METFVDPTFLEKVRQFPIAAKILGGFILLGLGSMAAIMVTVAIREGIRAFRIPFRELTADEAEILAAPETGIATRVKIQARRLNKWMDDNTGFVVMMVVLFPGVVFLPLRPLIYALAELIEALLPF